jgi:hypothetical protein
MDLTQEISHKAQENGVVLQQVRDLESHLCVEETLLSSLRHSSECDQELHRHRVFLQMRSNLSGRKHLTVSRVLFVFKLL